MTTVYWSPDADAAAHAFDTTRKPGQIAAALRADPIASVGLVEVAGADDAHLALVHTPTYVEAIRTGTPEELANSSELPWDPGIDRMARASVECAVAAAQQALQSGPTDRAGGLATGLHHARAERGDGYCTFNGLAIAARTVLGLGAERVLILDLDAHCGGGTRAILGGDPRCAQIDIATDEYDAYPAADGWSLDLIDDADRYLDTVEQRLAMCIRADQPDLVLYNAGMDCHEGSGDGALTGVTAELLAEREALVFGWANAHAVPLAWVLAGGYRSDTLSADDVIALHRLTVEAATR